MTVLIYTYNSEPHMSECIESAQLLTKSVIVVDMGSGDGTKSIAAHKKVKVVTVPYHIYVEPVRMQGIEAVKTDWFLILDADERVTEELAAEIKEKIASTEFTSYQVPRKNIFNRKKWLEFGGWYPDYQTRLIKHSAIKNWPKKIHATPVIDGAQGRLTNPMLHYFHGTIENMVSKTAIYESIESNLLFDAKRKSSTLIFFRKFLGELYRRLIKHAGWRDGMIGVIESFYQAYSKTTTYLFLYEKQQA